MMIAVSEQTGALISECEKYRYRLWRDTRSMWSERGVLVFVMLNPSTADATEDDPTIRRCIDFARRWGFSRLEVANLFAWRATKPKRLIEAQERGDDIVGPENDRYIEVTLGSADRLVAAWGKLPGPLRARAEEVLRQYPGWMVLGRCKNGDPRHPLFVPKTAELVRWDEHY